MTEIVFDEDEGTVLQDDELIGTVWQMHSVGHLPHHRVRSGSSRSWAAETPEGTREWFHSSEEAIAWLQDQAV